MINSLLTSKKLIEPQRSQKRDLHVDAASFQIRQPIGTMLLFSSSFGWRRLLTLGVIVSHVAHGLNCTLCNDGSIPDDSILDMDVFINEGENVTCRDLFEAAPNRTTVDTCEIIQAEGATLCGCPLPVSNCTLCQDGSSVPDENISYVQGFPCGAIEVFVKSDERSGACEAYQVTAGLYCGCSVDESKADICRLCGDKLPDPGLLVPVEGDDAHEEGNVRPCSAIEFDATFFFSECASYQEQYGPACCGDLNMDPTSSAYPASVGTHKTMLLVILAAIYAVFD
jgi:hypothetical protein